VDGKCKTNSNYKKTDYSLYVDNYDLWKTICDTLWYTNRVKHLFIRVEIHNFGYVNYLNHDATLESLHVTFSCTTLILYAVKRLKNNDPNYVPPYVDQYVTKAYTDGTDQSNILSINVAGLTNFTLIQIDNQPFNFRAYDKIGEDNVKTVLNNMANFTANIPGVIVPNSNETYLMGINVFTDYLQQNRRLKQNIITKAVSQKGIPEDIMKLVHGFVGPNPSSNINLHPKGTVSYKAFRKKTLQKPKKGGFKKRKPRKTLKKRKSQR